MLDLKATMGPVYRVAETTLVLKIMGIDSFLLETLILDPIIYLKSDKFVKAL